MNAASTTLGEIARVFLKLGTISFGGPAVHIAMMEEEVVRRRGWLTREQFLDYLGAVNLIPGPNSTELAIHVGRERAGWPGLITAGACFILPAVLIVSGIAWAYVTFGKLPQVAHVLYAVKPVVIAVVLQALWLLGRSAIKSKPLGVLTVAAAAAAALGANELIVLAASGAAALTVQLVARARTQRRDIVSVIVPASTWQSDGTFAAATATAAAGASFGLWPLFTTFVKIGSVLFGSGYVLLAFLRADFVERLGWLTEQQLLDAVAVGQITPGPVFTTATFVGYILGGSSGAAVATLGIFLPAFVFVAISSPIVPRLRKSATASAVLDGVNVASLALMAVVTLQLGRAALVDPWTIAVAVLSAVLIIRRRVNSAWLVLVAAALGLAFGARV